MSRLLRGISKAYLGCAPLRTRARKETAEKPARVGAGAYPPPHRVTEKTIELCSMFGERVVGVADVTSVVGFEQTGTLAATMTTRL